MLTQLKTFLIKKRVFDNNLLLLDFKLKDPPEINFTSGQYIFLKIDQKPRLYSIFSPDYEKDHLTLFLKIIPGGLASSFFLKLKIGQEVNFFGPAGVFRLNASEKDKFFLTTSSGIAPFFSMIKSFVNKNPKSNLKLTLLWGLPQAKDWPLFDELFSLKERYQNFSFFYCLSKEKEDIFSKIDDQKKPFVSLGRVNDLFTKITKQFSKEKLNQCEYYLCANREIVSSLNNFLLEKGIKKENIFFEKF